MVTEWYNLNGVIVADFDRRFGTIFRKRKVDWKEHIVPIFRYLNNRARTCRLVDLDTYEYLAINSSTKLSKRSRDLRNEIDSVADEILKKIRSRRDEAEKKLEESGTKIGPNERKKKMEKFPPE